ncbi:MAG TPA: hypothetical protein VM582_08690 [Candidatus Thermoplasmatota archaeon]|nr:hypothetical protein [Candidatus Thermoplasmatota archaeon]
MRAGAALILLVLLASLPLARGADATVRAEVALGSSVADVLHVNLTADEGGESVSLLLPDGTAVALAPGERYHYAVPVARPAAAFALAAREDVLPTAVAEVALAAPQGWAAVASADALVFARDLRVERFEAGTTLARLATLGPAAPADAAYVSRGLAYLSAQHAEAPREMLVVRAPVDALDAPFVGDATVVVGAALPTDELARLLVRHHQGYRVVEVAPASAAWFREGEERLQLQMSLLAAGLRTTEEVDETFLRARAVADEDARLPQAAGGSTLARQKGLVVVRALDVALRDATGGAAALPDLLARLDRIDERLDSSRIAEEARALAGDAMTAFFDAYVYGGEWPQTPGVRDAAEVFVLSLALSPARAGPGEQVVAAYDAVNRGTKAGETDLVLRLDGEPVRTSRVRLDVGERARGSLTLVADRPGEHVVRFGARNATLHVLSPALLSLARVAVTPDEPRTGEPFALLVYVENAGGASARARVEVYDAGRLAQRTTEALVRGGATEALTLPLRVEEPGRHVFEVRLIGGPAARDLIEHAVDVRPAERAQDVPAPTGALVALAALVALLRARRR